MSFEQNKMIKKTYRDAKSLFYNMNEAKGAKKRKKKNSLCRNEPHSQIRD